VEQILHNYIEQFAAPVKSDDAASIMATLFYTSFFSKTNNTIFKLNKPLLQNSSGLLGIV
jgi:hypothetical protein